MVFTLFGYGFSLLSFHFSRCAKRYQVRFHWSLVQEGSRKQYTIQLFCSLVALQFAACHAYLSDVRVRSFFSSTCVVYFLMAVVKPFLIRFFTTQYAFHHQYSSFTSSHSYNTCLNREVCCCLHCEHILYQLISIYFTEYSFHYRYSSFTFQSYNTCLNG
ncbi:hypothetical protein VTN77DRAFT_2129 [Rasamsonia byssochlamydoides]|uniref:uncharacterized protein n=1 Tax=Rasamsonia byssochlamydoides TaxID=89139 RepID=UPI0037440618